VRRRNGSRIGAAGANQAMGGAYAHCLFRAVMFGTAGRYVAGVLCWWIGDDWAGRLGRAVCGWRA